MLWQTRHHNAVLPHLFFLVLSHLFFLVLSHLFLLFFSHLFLLITCMKLCPDLILLLFLLSHVKANRSPINPLQRSLCRMKIPLLPMLCTWPLPFYTLSFKGTEIPHLMKDGPKRKPKQSGIDIIWWQDSWSLYFALLWHEIARHYLLTKLLSQLFGTTLL